jgi:hypothetical protein
MIRQLEYLEQRQYVIESIRDFLEGTGGEWDWDDFISIPTGFPDLEAAQNFCASISLTHPDPQWYCSEAGFNLMRDKLQELERFASLPVEPGTQI